MNEKEDETHWKRRREDTTKRKKRPERESSRDFHLDTMEAFAKEEVEQVNDTTSTAKRGLSKNLLKISITTTWKISSQSGKYHHEVETLATAPLPPPTAHTAGRQVSPQN